MAEQIKLVGIFDDRITPKLKALNKQLTLLNRKFKQFDRSLTGVNKKMKSLAKSSKQISRNFALSNKNIGNSSKHLQKYAKSAQKAAKAQDRLAKSQARQARSASRGGGGGGGGMGMFPGFMGGMGGVGRRGIGRMPARMGAMMGGKGLAKAAAMVGKIMPMVAGVVVGAKALQMAFSGLTSAIDRAVKAGIEAESQAIGMASTIQTLGGVGDFSKSMQLANKNLAYVSKIAANLPGATQGYAMLLSQTMDDQIEAMGSLEAVQADLKKGKRSVTALLGVAGQLANLSPEMVGFDLMQLRVNPKNMRQSQVLNRNPALMKFYQEGLEKFGGDYFKSLEYGLKKAITEEQIEALTQTFAAQLEATNSAIFDANSGLFGFRRMIDESGTTVIGELGKMMGQVTRIVQAFIAMVPIDPMEILANIVKFVTNMLKAFANVVTRAAELLKPAIDAVADVMRILFSTVWQVIDGALLPFKLVMDILGAVVGGTAGDFNMLQAVIGILISPMVLLANVVSHLRTMFLSLMEGLASIPFIGGFFGDKNQYRKEREEAEKTRANLNKNFMRLFGIVDKDEKEARAAEKRTRDAGYGSVMDKLLGGGSSAGGGGMPSGGGGGGGTMHTGKGAKAAAKSQANVQAKTQAVATAAGNQAIVSQQAKTNDFLNKDLKAVRVYTYKIMNFQEEIFGTLGVMMGMSKRQLRGKIKQYNTGAGGGPGGAAFMGGGGGFGGGPGMSSGIQGGGGGSVGGFGVDPTKASNVIQAAEKNLGIMNGVAVQCANAMVAVHKSAGISTKVTQQAWDGMQSGEQLASRFFGDDVGQKIMGKENLKIGDMLAFKNTYGNWKDGTITHVGMYAGKNEAGEHMMYDHTKRGGLVKRKMSTFGDKFLYGSRLHGMKGAAAAGGPIAGGVARTGGAYGEQSLTAALDRAGITHPTERAMFMAQMAHESGGFKYKEEIASGAAYEGRRDLGNTQAGDGKRYKGRGYIQLTGRANYAEYGKKIGADLVNNPDLAKNPDIAAAVAVEYWKTRVNRGAAQRGDVHTVTRNINGGLNGLSDRQQRFSMYQARGVPQAQLQGARPTNAANAMAGGGGGGGGIHVGNMNVTMNGVNDAERMSQQILDATKKASHSQMQ